MATCDVGDLMTAARCFLGQPWRQVEAIKAALLCQILQTLDPMATCDVGTLIRDAACFMGLEPQKVTAIQTQLLCEILSAGGVTGQTCLLRGEGAPTSTPPCSLSIYADGANVWLGDSSTGLWEQILP